MLGVAILNYDLWFDPNEVGGDFVVECWISHGPRKDDPEFDPQPGDWQLISDDEDSALRARVTRRLGNRVWLQIELPTAADAVA
ncbi:MAG TPA: hypothetical protein VMU77_06295 [Acidimicrobiales bacterium]|nr:hypothetical protein [Acidimicrobiales bacterium]